MKPLISEHKQGDGIIWQKSLEQLKQPKKASVATACVLVLKRVFAKHTLEAVEQNPHHNKYTTPPYLLT